jgi:Concanavalin A-like lectin/glucanases superfamily
VGAPSSEVSGVCCVGSGSWLVVARAACWVAAGTAVTVAAASVAQVPAIASPVAAFQPLAVQAEHVVNVTKESVLPYPADPAASKALRATPGGAGWPAAGLSTVDLPVAGGGGVGASAAVRAAALPVSVRQAASGGSSAGSAAPSRVAVQVLDRTQTISWVRLDGGVLPTNNETALSQGGGFSSAFLLGYEGSSGPPHRACRMQDGDAAGAAIVGARSPTALTTADLRVWHHLAGTYDAGTNTMRLYVDGQLVATTTRTAAPWDATGAFRLGSAVWTASGAQPSIVDFWGGAVDNVRAFIGVLSAADVANLFNQ